MNIIKGAGGVELVEASLEDSGECLIYIAGEPECRTLFLSRRNASAELVSTLLANPKMDRVLSLSIMACIENLRHFERCSGLTAISFGFEDSVFDFSKLQLLRRLGGVWSKKWTGLDSCESLIDIHVSKFSGGISALPCIEGLRRLTLIQPSFSSLSGLELANNLNFLEVSWATKLKDVSALNAMGRCLEELIIDSCKKIVNYEALHCLGKLKRLAITESSALKSLSFLRGMTALEFLSIFETPLADKDLSLCLECQSMKEFRCENRRGYIPAVNDVVSSIGSRSLFR